MSIGNCFYCGQYGGHTATCEGVAKQKQREELRELRAALQERDAEIAKWKVKEADWTTAYQSAYREATEATVRGFQLDGKLAAQRKVLEMALEALKYCAQEAGPCEHESGFCVCKEVDAITAIQEQLK